MPDVPLDYLQVARVSGTDAGDFLQGQLSADLTGLRNGQASLACYCSADGRIIAVMLVIKQSDHWLLVLHRELMTKVLDLLRRYVLRADVDVSVTELAVAGREDALNDSGEISVSVGGASLVYCLSNAGPPEKISDGQRADQWRSLEIKAGLVWLDQATSGQYLPQMLGLDRSGAVSFRKGCFPGQEVIARTRYLGKVKRRPLVVEGEGELPVVPGDKVELVDSAGQSASGKVVDLASQGEKGMTLFLVSSMDPGLQVAKIRSGPRELPIRRIDQAWATI